MEKEKQKGVGVVAQIIPTYSVELSDRQERTVTNVVTVLKKNNVKDEMTHARILARNKAFVNDVFNAGVEAGIL